MALEVNATEFRKAQVHDVIEMCGVRLRKLIGAYNRNRSIVEENNHVAIRRSMGKIK